MRKRLVVFEGRVHFDLVWFLAKSRASTHSTIMRKTRCGLHGRERHSEFDLVWFLAKSRASTHSTIMRNTNCGLHGGERHLEFFRSPPRAPSEVPI